MVAVGSERTSGRMDSPSPAPQDEFVQVVNAMTASIVSAHAVLRTLLEKYVGLFHHS